MKPEDERPILAPGPRLTPIEIPGRDPVPVTLLTGFLGAGKTTLLNRILNGEHGLRVGVLVNDFGSINIDAELVEGVEENTINLTNGCVCCEIRDDLVNSLEQLLTRDDVIDYVILEASGVAEPEGIVMTFLNARYEKLLRLDSITCVVDAEAIFTHAENEELTALKLRQIGFADMVLLNKVDLVGPTHLEVIEDWIGQHLQRIRIVQAQRCDVPLEILLAVGRFDPAHLEAQQQNPELAGDQQTASQLFSTWNYESDQPFSIEKLETMVRRQLPASIYRCKGIVYCAEAPEQRHALQAVGRRTELTALDDWDARPPCTRIVAIGTGFDPGELTELFDNCLAETTSNPIN
ncbi:CobW family GTP-binding protein [Gimesia chilikensis]|uniref:CobW family GTP-binding protein n=1 Tax=Gimesia chilikensis TaxID=2605989 RepID=UPI00118868E4|nr:GTP-binding protein [Gimesia chilikensis]QDT87165.1 Putative metal chaperone YciC [Gimesia chilikensis]